MKKLSTLCASALLLTATAPAVFSDTELTGHRVGIGYSSTDLVIDDSAFDWGNGIKLEYGYDFNHIAGINVSYQRNNDDTRYNSVSAELDGSAFKVDTDLGYTFQLDGFSIKPYGAIGLVRGKEEITFKYSDGSVKDSYKDTSLMLGTGVRANLDMGLYADLRFDFYSIDSVDTDQFSFTIGYMF